METDWILWLAGGAEKERVLAIVAAPSLLTLNSNIRRETKGTTKTLESHAGISSLLTTLWFGGLGFPREYVYVEQWKTWGGLCVGTTCQSVRHN